LASSIKPAFDYILNNVFHSLEFYKSMSSNVAEGFIIVGGGSYLKNSNDYSSEYLNLKAINFSDNLTLNGLESVDLRKLPFLANVLGLVFHQDKDINLLPEDYKRQHAEQKSKKYRIIGIALSLVLIATALYLPRYFVESLKNKRINVEQEITSKLEYEDLKKLEENLQKDIERRTRLIASFQASYLKWSEVLAEIGSNVPQGLAIDSLTYSEDLEISGQAESYNLVAQFIVNLNNMDIISEVQPLSVFDFDGIYQFKIKCFIEGEGKNEAD
jgi:Tfp pilus assembly protein PilN